MSIKSSISFLSLITAIFLTWSGANGKTFQENPLTKAIQLFDKEKYTEAEPLFKNILDNRPDDFMVNYFYGACRTENGHYGAEDLGYLIKASKEVNPLNIDYYLAVQYHAKNQWERALAYYKLYKSTASSNDQEKVGLAIKMEQCSNHINPFSSAESDEIKIAPEIKEARSANLVSDKELQSAIAQMAAKSVANDSTYSKIEEKPKLDELESSTIDSTNQILVPEPVSFSVKPSNEEPVKEPVKTIPANERIKFSVNNEITYLSNSNFKTEEGKNFFDEGTLTDTELQKVLIRTEILRGKYKSAQSRAERDSIGQIILSLEGEAYDLKNSVTQMFIQAKNAENGYWSNASPEETEGFIKEINAASTKINNERTVDSIKNSEIIIPPILIQDEEIKNETSNANSGVTYKIQLGAYSRGIPNSLKAVFNKISILRKVENYTDENGVVVYTTGNLTNYNDAVEMQKQIRQEGIKDPIIAAYLNGKRITLEKAKEIDNIQ